MKHKKAFTLVELMVTIIITAGIAGTIYHFISHAQYVAALTAAKAKAKQNAELVMRFLERDIVSSRAIIDRKGPEPKMVKTLAISGSNLELDVAKESDLSNNNNSISYFGSNKDGNAENYRKVKYTLEGKKLIRTDQLGPTKTLSKNVDTFEIEENYDGRVLIKIKTVFKVRGTKASAPYTLRNIVTVREAQKTLINKHWKRNFSTDPNDCDY